MDAIAKSASSDQKTADESLSLSHFLEQAHAIGEQAEQTPRRLSETARPTIEWFVHSSTRGC